jgi:hypothetical protein
MAAVAGSCRKRSTASALKSRMRDDPPRPHQPKVPLPPVPTLGQIRKHTAWFWVSCGGANCDHYVPMALTPFIIRWGADASSDVLRDRIVCSACGHHGVTLQHPGWVDREVGYQPFPVGTS